MTTPPLRLPWSAVRDATIYARGLPVSVRFVACKCPHCGQRNRVIVHEGGRPMTSAEVAAAFGRDGALPSWFANPSDRQTPAWTCASGTRAADPCDVLSFCAECYATWCVSMHANRMGSRGTPVPLRDDDPEPDDVPVGTQVFHDEP